MAERSFSGLDWMEKKRERTTPIRKDVTYESLDVTVLKSCLQSAGVFISIWALYGGNTGFCIIFSNSIAVLFIHYVVGICGHGLVVFFGSNVVV